MIANGCAYLVAEVCIEHLESCDNPGFGLQKINVGFKIQDSRIRENYVENLES